MASTDSAAAKKNTRPEGLVKNNSFAQEVRVKVKTLIEIHFSNTLGKMSPHGIEHVVNLVMGLIYKESSFRPDNLGKQYPLNSPQWTEAYTYAKSAVIKPMLASSGQQRFNAVDAARAFGLMQVNGYYIIKGAFGGKGELLRMSPLAEPLMINPGDSVRDKLHGAQNVDNQLLAGLIVLQEKLRIAPGKVRDGSYGDVLTATFAGYLGHGAKDLIGTTPTGYASSIIGGDAYAKANGKGVSMAAVSNPTFKAAAAGPVKTAASGQKLAIAGCA